MAFCGFAKGAAMYDTTPIENMFLMEHLPAAPAQYVKVYLYARMLCLHPELGGTAADVAAMLRMDEDAVLDAMAYWEQQGLARRLSDQPPTYELLPVNASAINTTAVMDRSYYEYRDFNADLQAFFPDQMLHPAEFSRAVDWVNVMGFSQEAVLLAVKREVGLSRSKAPRPSALFRRLDKKMLEWSGKGLTSAEALEREFGFSDQVRGTASEVLKRLGLRRAATEDELVAVRRWLEEWRYTGDQILEACGETTRARTPTIAYLDAVLKNRLSGESAGFGELSDILRELTGRSEAPTPDELGRYAALRAAGFEADTVRLAAVQCRRKRKTTFEDLNWMLEEWQKLKLFSRADAERYVREMDAKRTRMRAVLKLCGLERGPRMDDLELLDAWQAALPEDVIDYAATLARGMQNPVRYMDRLLQAWAASGISTVEAARAQHEARQADGGRSSGGPAPNPALNYEQRDYSDRKEEDFFIDLEKAVSDGGDGA